MSEKELESDQLNLHYLPELDEDTIKFLSNTDKSKESAINIFGESNVNDGYFTCKGCGKQVSNADLKIFNSNVVKGITAKLCKDCWDYVVKEGGVFLVCMKCKEIRKIMEPFKNQYSGFEFKKGGIYHLEDCPVCNPEKFVKDNNEPIPMVIIEEAIYNRKLNEIKNKDLIK
jgi:hypothetical protein